MPRYALGVSVLIPAPMLASPGGKPFTSPDWLYEIKFDGYRCMAGIAKHDGFVLGGDAGRHADSHSGFSA
jgi:hypothetical protein